MALIKCEECGHMISDRATRCVKCGCPVEKKTMEEVPISRVEKPVIAEPVVTPCPAPTDVTGPTIQPQAVQPQSAPQAQTDSLEQVTQQSLKKDGRGENIAIVLLSVALVSFVGVGLYLLIRGTATNTSSIKGHEYVDLGLSVKWATCNVGASSPSDYGDYFAWGETSPKSEYSAANSKTEGKSLGSIAGNPTYDVARAKWRGTWRLPTADEMDELLNECIWTWTTEGGQNGFKVTGPNGNSIFLPAAGYHYFGDFLNAGSKGGYWSATPSEKETSCAYNLAFSIYIRRRELIGRYIGRTVRPVSD